MRINALLIPAEEALPIRRVTIADDRLEDLQAAVGGLVEPVPYHADAMVTAYVNELGKVECEANPRATQLLGPGLYAGDYIAGDVLICGFDSNTGANADCPVGFEARLNARRQLPEANLAMQREQLLTREWALKADPDCRFTVAVLLAGYEPAGVDAASGESHGNQFRALLANRTERSDLALVTGPSDGGESFCVCREAVPGFSQFGLELFADLALARLRDLYGKSDPRVTRFFALASGAAL